MTVVFAFGVHCVIGVEFRPHFRFPEEVANGHFARHLVKKYSVLLQNAFETLPGGLW